VYRQNFLISNICRVYIARISTTMKRFDWRD